MKRFNLPYKFNERTFIMGVLNVTPDSFYDGGLFLNPVTALKQAQKMAEDGVDIIDIGAESSRPGADPISAEEEIRRLSPVIKLLLKETNIPISLDTYKSEVAKKFLDQGVQIINDISGLRFDAKMAKIVASYHVPVIIMHAQGKPKTMQENPVYINLIDEIIDYLKKSIKTGMKAGIKKERFIVDPGIGFGKRVGDNLKIIKNLNKFKKLDCPILIGVSRKSFIGHILDLPVTERLEGTLAAVCVSIMNGANIIRVHDVKEAKRAAKITDEILRN